MRPQRSDPHDSVRKCAIAPFHRTLNHEQQQITISSGKSQHCLTADSMVRPRQPGHCACAKRRVPQSAPNPPFGRFGKDDHLNPGSERLAAAVSTLKSQQGLLGLLGGARKKLQSASGSAKDPACSEWESRIQSANGHVCEGTRKNKWPPATIEKGQLAAWPVCRR